MPKRKIDPWFDPDATKTCTWCGETKPIRQFGRAKDARKSNGYRIGSRCNPCKAVLARERRAAHKASEQQPYYEDHKKRQRAASRALTRLRNRFPEAYEQFYLEEIEREFPEGRPGKGRPKRYMRKKQK